MDNYRDVHGSRDTLKSNIELVKNSVMSNEQKEDILKFVEDLKIGKNGESGSGKKVKERRINNYLQFLLKLNEYFKKDFNKLSEEETTQFYKDISENKIKKLNGMPYAQASKDEFVKTLKRYLGWKWGRENKKYIKSVKWMKEDYKGSNKKAICLKDVKQIISLEKSIRNKCLFMFLFDSGARIEEGLNVCIGDLKTNNKGDLNYFIVHLRGKKTAEADRTIPIPLSTKYLNEWLKEHPSKEDKDFLFPINYDNARKIIKQMSNKALGFKVKPHELRHSSATHYIQFGGYGAENIGGFYYRYGWRFGSDEALTYIKTYMYGGELGHEKVVKHIVSDRVEELEHQVEKLKKIVKDLPDKLMSKIIGVIKEKPIKTA